MALISLRGEVNQARVTEACKEDDKYREGTQDLAQRVSMIFLEAASNVLRLHIRTPL